MTTAEQVTVAVRPAELRDVRAIQAIDAQVYTTPWSEKLTIAQVTGPGRVHLVAEEQHRVIGHGGIVILDGDAHITTVAIDPAHQRRGLGSVLVTHLLRAAEVNGCSAVTLEVRVSNRAAIAMYEKHGFESAGSRPGYYGDNGEDAMIMWSNDGSGAERQWSDPVGRRPMRERGGEAGTNVGERTT